MPAARTTIPAGAKIFSPAKVAIFAMWAISPGSPARSARKP
jgi:hypothetical protein